MRRLLRYVLPELGPVSNQERFRAAAGALLGILATGWVSRAAVGDTASLPVLIAPMGASAVLLFAVPAGPLAQPWSILGGNLVGATVGVVAAALVPDPFLASAAAIGFAIAGMMALRCLHPPSGAVALTAVLGGSAIRDLGYGFILWPVAANSLLLLASAVLFNNLTGRRYPHIPFPVPQKEGGPALAFHGGAGFTSSDLDAVLKSHDELLDISRSDLESILQEAQLRAWGRRAGDVTCAAIMSRNVVAVAPSTRLADALDLLRRHHIKMLPVTDERARVVGVVTQTDLLDKASWSGLGPRLGLGRRLRLTLRRGRAPTGSVEDIMTGGVKVARPEMPLRELVLSMLGQSHHHLPVVGKDDKLVGIVAQSDVISALLAGEAAGVA